MIDWNAIATPPAPVPHLIVALVRAIDRDARSRMSQEVFFEALDKQDARYFQIERVPA